GEDAFAALLATFAVPADGEVLPAAGKNLPVGASSPPRDPAAVGPLGDPTAAGTQPMWPSVTARAGMPAAGVPGSAVADAVRLVRPAGASSSSPALDAVPSGAASSGSSASLPATERPASAYSIAAGTASTPAGGVDAPNPVLATSIPPAIDAASAGGVEALPVEQGAAASSTSRISAAGSMEPETPTALDARFEEFGDSAAAGDGGERGGAGRQDAGDGTVRRDASDVAVARDAARAAVPVASGAEPATGSSGLAATSGVAAPSAPIDASGEVSSAATSRLQESATAPRGAPADVGESVAGRIRMMVDQGAGEARLRLNPPELGSIDVRISLVDDK